MTVVRNILTETNVFAAEEFDPDAETTMRVRKQSKDGLWTFLRPECQRLRPRGCTIYTHAWNVEDFTDEASMLGLGPNSANTLGQDVLRHIVCDLGDWLRPDAFKAVAVPRVFETVSFNGILRKNSSLTSGSRSSQGWPRPLPYLHRHAERLLSP